MKEFVVKLTKTILVLKENEFFQLPPDILEQAIKRGKAYKRVIECEKRQQGRKGNIPHEE